MIKRKVADTQGLIFQLSLFGKTKSDLLKKLKTDLKRGGSLTLVATPNPEQVVQTKQDPKLLANLQQFDLLLPDGQGLVWATQLLAGKSDTPTITERIPGRAVVKELLSIAAELSLKVLIVGGRGYDQQAGIDLPLPLVSVFDRGSKPASSAIYWVSAYDKVAEPKVAEEIALKEIITQMKPDMIFVAFGAPYQERWIIEHRSLLEKNQVRLAMTVGGSFDYLLGKVPAVPAFMSALGLEWLWRLLTEPWRWRRQLRLITFIGLVLKELIRR